MEFNAVIHRVVVKYLTIEEVIKYFKMLRLSIFDDMIVDRIYREFHGCLPKTALHDILPEIVEHVEKGGFVFDFLGWDKLLFRYPDEISKRHGDYMHLYKFIASSTPWKVSVLIFRNEKSGGESRIFCTTLDEDLDNRFTRPRYVPIKVRRGTETYIVLEFMGDEDMTS